MGLGEFLPFAAADRPDVVHVAVLPLSATAEQSAVAPFRNVTDPTPSGLPPSAVTVAVKVTEPPYVEGLELLWSKVIVSLPSSP